MIRAASLLIASLSIFAASPAYCQSNGMEEASSSNAPRLRDMLEEDDPPQAPESAPLRSSDGAAEPDTTQAKVQSKGQATALGVVSAAAAVRAAAVAPPAAAVKPQAVAAKLAIRDALARGDKPAAERLFMEALDRFPSDPDLREVRNQQTLRLHDEKIRAIFDRTLTESRKLFGRQWLPGQTMDEGEWNIELQKERIGGARPPGSSARTALVNGYALMDRGDPVRAEQVLSGAIGKNSDSAPLYYARVMARGMSGNLKGADEDSIKAVSLSREMPATLSQRSMLMMQSRRREEAFAWADRALKGDPGDADALAVRGRFLWRDRARYDLALADLKQAARISPERYQNLYQEAQKRFYGQRARSSLGKGDDKQALADADLALASDAGDATAHMVRGAVFSRAGKPEETIKETTLALKSDRRSGEALLYRGMALETLGHRSRALADFERAAEIDPVRFRRFYERLVQAQREGAPPLWSRGGGSVAASN